MRVILVSKNFSTNRNISHIGLGVAGLNTSKVLSANGIHTEVWQVVDSNELRQRLNLAREDHHHITHVVISAPWIHTHALNHLCSLFPRTQFAVSSHSNVGFLQADPQGMKLFREGLELEMALTNFRMAANSKKMCRWVEDAYGHPCQLLPNLYFLNKIHKSHRKLWDGGILKIGIFGATRPQKNLASAVGSAIELSYQLKIHTQIWLSSGRNEGGGNTILNTIREMVKDLPNVSLHEAGWQTWPRFRQLVGSMHLLIQPSYTESFNMVTADGVAEGVPSVVSEAIDWVPQSWVANADDVFDIAKVGRHLIHDHHAASEGLEHLISHVEAGLKRWKTYLESTIIPSEYLI